MFYTEFLALMWNLARFQSDTKSGRFILPTGRSGDLSKFRESPGESGRLTCMHVVKDGGSPIPYRFLTMHPPSLANDRNIPHPFIYQLICIISHNSIVKLNNSFCLRSSMY